MSNKTNRILALHGFTGCGEDFAGFSPLCHTVDAWHCPDLPGHGPGPSLHCTPDATIKFLDVEATGLSRSALPPAVSDRTFASTNILLGYSMGARAALLHAVRYPQKWDALILISPNPGIEDEAARAERQAVDAKLAQRIEDEGVDAFIEFWQSTPMIRSQKNIRPEWRAAMGTARKRHAATGLAASLRQFGQGQCPNLWPDLNKLSMPVLLLTGKEDLKYTRIAERMQESMRGGQRPLRVHWQSIENSGHMPHLESPESVARQIDDFLRNC